MKITLYYFYDASRYVSEEKRIEVSTVDWRGQYIGDRVFIKEIEIDAPDCAKPTDRDLAKGGRGGGMSGHTKEPWKVVNENGFVSVINADTGVVVFPEMHANDCKEDMRRTVACVNALQHISTEILESGHMQNLVMQVRIAEEQRDELLSALSEAVNLRASLCDSRNQDGDPYLEKWSSAIAKAEAA